MVNHISTDMILLDYCIDQLLSTFSFDHDISTLQSVFTFNFSYTVLVQPPLVTLTSYLLCVADVFDAWQTYM